MNLGMRQNILEKILEMLQAMPDAEKGEESGEMSEMAEGMPEKGKLEVMAISAKPKSDEKDMMKGC
jgi:hypothetical protein